ncbi:uncharacterized protein LOC116168122 [Photinus pyralis]|uniref:uncharacterized protein LOC116168122 n=1 Tax=Photinus pyralis TaxID=7054 RepID=UPI0012675234|nr:uncharacterized protein LOC116168122 [Photinus pyralis]
MHNLIVTNTFYKHKDIHKYTRVEPGRDEKSIIDYILVPENLKSDILDVRVRRGSEIGSDHYLLVARIKNVENHKEKELSCKKMEFETIKTYKLSNMDIAKKYKETTHRKMTETAGSIGNMSLQQLWIKFKNITIETAREICGICKHSNKRKQTSWWTNDIREKVEGKKTAWKKYLANRNDENYNFYKEQRRLVKDTIIKAKQTAWIKFGEKLQRDSKNHQKLFYKVLKTLKEGKTNIPMEIKDKYGEKIKNEEQIMVRWQEYFEKLLDGENNTSPTTHERSIRRRTRNTNENVTGMITGEDIEETLKEIKNNKAPGHDKITGEMIKNMGFSGKELLRAIYTKAWEEERVPQDWEIGVIVPVHKKGDNKDCNNYRGITLISTVMKIYEQILNKKLTVSTEQTLTDTQSGFRKGRSVQDHIFTIKQMIEKKKLGGKVYFAFIDLVKAFDSIPRDKVWESLLKRNVDNKLVRVIKSLYKSTLNYVIWKNMKSGFFATTQGLRQGGGLSPTLFNIFMDDVIKSCNANTQKAFIGYRQMNRVLVSECAFADDIVIITNTEQDLQNNLKVWDEELRSNGMSINTTKTKVMAIGAEELNPKITLREETIEHVKQFKYLGTISVVGAPSKNGQRKTSEAGMGIQEPTQKKKGQTEDNMGREHKEDTRGEKYHMESSKNPGQE